MPQQYVVPQFIDVEAKIIGPVTVRQFIIMLGAVGILFVFFKLFDFALFLIMGIPLAGFAFVLAFVRINGQPFHFFLLNALQTLRKARVRTWNKRLTVAELKHYIMRETPPPPPPLVRKVLPGASRLQELTLVVNTGGIYKPEEFM